MTHTYVTKLNLDTGKEVGVGFAVMMGLQFRAYTLLHTLVQTPVPGP